MAATSLEERVAALEADVERLKQAQVNTSVDASTEEQPWWEKIIGTFANDPIYDEAMRLGREYRESLRPTDADDVPA